jgi:hypothetical protein
VKGRADYQERFFLKKNTEDWLQGVAVDDRGLLRSVVEVRAATHTHTHTERERERERERRIHTYTHTHTHTHTHIHTHTHTHTHTGACGHFSGGGTCGGLKGVTGDETASRCSCP